MILKTVKEYIEELPNITFHQFYISYIMKVQDDNIELESKFLSANNLLDVGFIENTIMKEFARIENDSIN